MAITNIALRKTATASGYVMPYEPARAVDGSYTTPVNRWLCNGVSSTTPARLTVDLGGLNVITSWIVRHMSVAGWASPDYNMCDFKLQVSSDNNTWTDVDSVTDNSAGITNRTISSLVVCRYVRLYVTKGIRTNPQLASVMELEVYGQPTPYLSGLSVNAGATCLTLNPSFAPLVFNYTTANVPYATSSVTVIPTPQSSTATVKVNGVAVTSTAGIPVALNVGSNTINVVVTAVDGTTTQTYTVTIIRAAGAYMQSLAIKAPDGTNVPLNIAFNKDTQNYTATVGYDITSVNVIAISSDGTTNVIVNGQTVPSGQAVAVNNLIVGTNSIAASVVDDTKTYTISLTRASSPYLSGLSLKSGKSTISYTPAFNRNTTQYTTAAMGGKTNISITVTTEDISASINIGGTVVSSGQPATLNIPGGSSSIKITVTSSVGGSKKEYDIAVNN